jgi:hypothetical protein
MAGSNDAFPAQIRNAVIQQFTDSIQSADAGRQAALGAYIGTLQSELNGMTGAEASARIIQAIADMKSI